MVDGQEKNQLTHVLRVTYGRLLDDARIANLWRALEDESASDVAAAIDAHITDTTPNYNGQPVGNFPPSPAQLKSHIRAAREQAMQVRLQQSHQNDRLARGRECPECIDGVASFWVEIDAETGTYKPGRVWLRSEAAHLDDDVYARLRRKSAVCDCRAGHLRKERAMTTTIYDKKQRREIDVPVWPRLEFVRRIAERRARYEQDMAAGDDGGAAADRGVAQQAAQDTPADHQQGRDAGRGVTGTRPVAPFKKPAPERPAAGRGEQGSRDGGWGAAVDSPAQRITSEDDVFV